MGIDAFSEVAHIFVVKCQRVVFRMTKHHYVVAVAFGHQICAGFRAVCKYFKIWLSQYLCCSHHHMAAVRHTYNTVHIMHQRMLLMQNHVIEHAA